MPWSALVTRSRAPNWRVLCTGRQVASCSLCTGMRLIALYAQARSFFFWAGTCLLALYEQASASKISSRTLSSRALSSRTLCCHVQRAAGAGARSAADHSSLDAPAMPLFGASTDRSEALVVPAGAALAHMHAHTPSSGGGGRVKSYLLFCTGTNTSDGGWRNLLWTTSM